jgi:hypothetical protein
MENKVLLKKKKEENSNNRGSVILLWPNFVRSQPDEPRAFVSSHNGRCDLPKILKQSENH